MNQFVLFLLSHHVKNSMTHGMRLMSHIRLIVDIIKAQILHPIAQIIANVATVVTSRCIIDSKQIADKRPSYILRMHIE